MKLDTTFQECEQPDSTEFYLANKVFVKSGLFKKSGCIVPQHSHEDDHTTFIATGAVHAWKGEEYLGWFQGPVGVFIEKRQKHTFKTTEDNTVILCIHNIAETGMVELHDLHDLTFP